MERIPRLLQLISFMRNVGPLRVGPERSQRRLVAKFGGDMPHSLQLFIQFIESKCFETLEVWVLTFVMSFLLFPFGGVVKDKPTVFLCS